MLFMALGSFMASEFLAAIFHAAPDAGTAKDSK
jgi:hypothetical protein